MHGVVPFLFLLIPVCFPRAVAPPASSRHAFLSPLIFAFHTCGHSTRCPASSDLATESDRSTKREGSRRTSKLRLRSKTSKSAKRSSSPAPFEKYDHDDVGTTRVYRGAAEWSQAPCTACATFNFCDYRGPVNAKDCVYYGE